MHMYGFCGIWKRASQFSNRMCLAAETTHMHTQLPMCVCVGKPEENQGKMWGKQGDGKWARAEVSERWTGIKSLFYAVV